MSIVWFTSQFSLMEPAMQKSTQQSIRALAIQFNGPTSIILLILVIDTNVSSIAGCRAEEIGKSRRIKVSQLKLSFD